MAAEQFIANLADAAERGDGQIRVVLTLRADFLDRCLAYPDLRKLLEDRQLLLGPLAQADLRDAIVRPAQQVGAFLEKGLVNAILADVGDEPGNLPLVQHALHELWLARRGPWLTLDAYEASGGVAGALGRRAQATYDALPPEQQIIARNILLRLATLGEGVSDTRRRAERAELYPVGVDPAQVNAVIQALSGPDARLLVTDEDTVDMAHEALIQGWSALRGWLEASREALRTQHRLTEAANEWGRDRDESYLYRGVRLAEIEEWAAVHGRGMNALEAEFVRISVAMRDREALREDERRRRELEQAQALAREQQQRAEAQKASAIRLRQRALLAGMIGLVALVFAFFAIRFGLQAQANANRARTLEQYANEKADDLQVALVGEREALIREQDALSQTVKTLDLLSTREVEARAAQATAEFARVEEAEAREMAVDERNRAEEQVRVARSRQFATYAEAAWPALPQRSLLLGVEALRQTLDAGEPSVPAAEDVVRQALVSFSGQTLGGHQGGVTVAAISPDGRWLASGGGSLFSQKGDTNLHWWDLEAPDPAVSHQVIPLGDGFLYHARFSPDAHWLVGSTLERQENELRVASHLWKVSAAGLRSTSWLSSTLPIAFSADGRWLVSSQGGLLGGESSGLLLWDMMAVPPTSNTLMSAPLTVLSGFETDQRWLVASGADGRLYLWDLLALSPTAAPVSLPAMGEVKQVAASRDGRWLAASRAAGPVHVWNLARPDAPPTALDAGIEVDKLAFSPNGRWLLVQPQEGSISLWRLEDPGPVSPSLLLSGRFYGSLQIAFSPDSRWLAVAVMGVAPRVLDMRAPDPPASELVLTGQSCGGLLVISADSRWLVAVDGAQTCIWDLAANLSGQDPVVLRGRESSNMSPSISQAGRWLAVGGSGMVQLHDLTQPLPVPPGTLRSTHRSDIEWFGVTQDGHWLVTADDYDTRLWDLTGPAISRVITTTTGYGNKSPTLSPDRRWLIFEGADGAIYRTDMQAADPVAGIGKLSGPVSNVQRIHVDRDSREIVALAADAKLYRWRLAEPDRQPEVQALPGGDSSIGDSRISPDNRWVVMGFRVPVLFVGVANQTLLWDTDAAAGAGPYNVKAEQSATSAVAFSADSRTLFTASTDGAVRAWDLAAPDPTVDPRLLRGNPYLVTALAASPDGRWLVAGTGCPLIIGECDHSVRLWDLALADPGAPPLILRGHAADIRGLAFSSDGRWLVTGDSSSVLRLWDLAAAQPSATVRQLPGDAGDVSYFAFSADDLTLISASQDGIIRFAPLRAESLLAAACRAVGRNLSVEEWQRYFPSEDYRPTCSQWPDALW